MDAPDTEKMNIVVVGHVDHGKSTVIGRLLLDTGALPVGKIEQIQNYCERNALPFEYAFLIDALKDERRQNITIDAARVFFNSQRRRYIIMDAPGHIEFVKNMITGAARAEAALLVIDAQEGICENSRRHGHLLSLMGVHQVAVLVNKMDLVDYSQERFSVIVEEYGQFLASVGLQAVGFIPVSARHGDNISQPSPRMPWYGSTVGQKTTVLQTLDGFEKEKLPVDRPFRLPVQDIYRFTESGDKRRIVAGTIASGRISAGDEIIFYPSGKRSWIEQIESWPENGPTRQPSIAAGQAVGFSLREQVYVQRGEIAGRADELPPQTSRRFRVSLFWLGQAPLTTNKTYVVKLGTARRRAHVEKILRVMDASSLEERGERTQVERNELADCILETDHILAYDLPDGCVNTSRFVIVDGYDIRGGGVIREGLPDFDPRVYQQVQTRNAHWIPTGITPAERAQAYHQHSCLVIITGKKGVGRKRLARELEERLFRDGKFVYYLGMGSVVYGVDADIAGHADPPSRHEHVRRMAEVANILLDAGLILIITAIELTPVDLDIFHTSLGYAEIVVVWVGDEENVENGYDLTVAANNAGEETVQQIKALFHERGIL